MKNLSILAKRYATALFSIAAKTGSEAAFADNLGALTSVFRNPKTYSYFCSPIVATDEQVKALSELLVQVPVVKDVEQFLLLLVNNRRFSLFPAVAETYARILADKEARIDVVFEAEQELKPEETSALVSRIEGITKKKVSHRFSKTEGLIGGLRILVGDTVIDASLATALQRLKTRIIHV